jgi:hypothetical protein
MGALNLSFVFLALGLFSGNAISGERYLEFTESAVKNESFVSAEDAAYFTIQDIKVTELEVSEEELQAAEVSAPRFESFGDKDLGTVIMSVEKLLALGQKIWKIVEAGRPVVSTNFTPAVHVLPKTSEDPASSFAQLENWSAPAYKKYRVEYSNLFGVTVIGFTYTVSFQYGGSFQGAGKYLTGVTVAASEISVDWGFNFDAASSLVTISNRGSSANPVAAATIKIDYTAKSVMREIRSSESFHVTGSGQVQKF